MTLPERQTEETEVITLHPTALQALSRLGLRPESIANATGMPISRVRTLITRHVLPPEEEQLAAQIRGLYLLAIQEAHKALEFGPTEQKMMIIKSLLGGNAIRFASASGGKGEEVREQLEQLFVGIREVPKVQEIVTEQGFEEEEVDNASEAGTPAERANDQDEGTWLSEARPALPPS